MNKTHNFTKDEFLALPITHFNVHSHRSTNGCSFSIGSKSVLFAPQEIVSIEGVMFRCTSAFVDYGYTVVHEFELHLDGIRNFLIELEESHKDTVTKQIGH